MKNGNNTKQMLLHARKQNWGELGPGSWTEVRCDIYYDGSYIITSEYQPLWDENTKRKQVGNLTDVDLNKLIVALNEEQWRDPTIDNSASCDGVAWEIVYYSNGGIIINSSERLDYIYGHSAMETIVSCLPEYINSFSASAFISATRIVPAYLAKGENANHRIEAWNKKGKDSFEQFIRETTEGLKEATVVVSALHPNICIGNTSLGSTCVLVNTETMSISDVFPIALNLESLNKLREDVKESGLGTPDDLHLDIVSITIAVDFINYYEDFINKKDISGRFALFKSNLLSTDIDDIIIIDVWNLGKIVIGYDAVKSIIDKYVDNSQIIQSTGSIVISQSREVGILSKVLDLDSDLF